MVREERTLYHQSLKTKDKYFLCIDGKNTNYLAMERSKNKKRTLWYPFWYDRDLKQPKQKYREIKGIGTDYGKIPSTGFTAGINSGYGFTRNQGVDRFFYYLTENLKKEVETVIFTQKETTIERKKLLLNIRDFGRVRSQTKSFTESSSKEEKHLHKTLLHTLLPIKVDEPEKLIYIPGSLKRYMSKYDDASVTLSADDAESVIQNLDVEKQAVLSTKNEVDRIYIEDVISEFKEIMSQKTNTSQLEERWHQFFKKHPWIFTNIFAYPATYFRDKFNVGGQDLSGGSDKIVDFLAKSNFTNNVAFVEIKTHKTPLTQKRPYRKPSIYSVSSHITGSIVQVVDQKTTFLKNFHARKGSEDVESLNSCCLIVVGSIKSLSDKDKRN